MARRRAAAPAAGTSGTEVTVVEGHSTALATWQDRLAQDAAQAVEQEANVGTGSMITFKAGVMTYQGNDIAGNEMPVVVIDSVLEHDYYGNQPFDPDNPVIPVCFAFGRDDKQMAPHEASEEPQNETCKGCQWLEWKSATDRQTGKPRKGKACQQRRKLMMVPEDVLKGGPEAIAKSEVAFAKLPVTSVRAWAAYVKTLAATYKRPPYAFVTMLSVVPDKDDQFHITFNMEATIENPAILQALVEKAASHSEELTRAYERQSVEEQAPPPRRGGPRAKAPPPQVRQAAPAAPRRAKY
jgi:hypothetical protein